jgi:hypothetical protein
MPTASSPSAVNQTSQSTNSDSNGTPDLNTVVIGVVVAVCLVGVVALAAVVMQRRASKDHNGPSVMNLARGPAYENPAYAPSDIGSRSIAVAPRAVNLQTGGAAVSGQEAFEC